MLDYSILKAKPTINMKSSADGTEYVKCKDLLSDVMNKDIKMSNCKFVEITENYIARPDLVSLAMYGNDSYADLICKVNGISNPFELNEGMLIIVPDLQTSFNLIKQGKETYKEHDDSEFIINTNKNTKKQKNSIRNSAEQTITDTNFIIDKKNNIVTY